MDIREGLFFMVFEHHLSCSDTFKYTADLNIWDLHTLHHCYTDQALGLLFFPSCISLWLIMALTCCQHKNNHDVFGFYGIVCFFCMCFCFGVFIVLSYFTVFLFGAINQNQSFEFYPKMFGNCCETEKEPKVFFRLCFDCYR